MKKQNDDEEALTLDEAAAFLKVHRRTAEAMLLKGHLPGKKLGRQWRILKSELIDFLRTR
jgi:excisionase family DNA binding protein